jgi:hypothetical protein
MRHKTRAAWMARRCSARVCAGESGGPDSAPVPAEGTESDEPDMVCGCDFTVTVLLAMPYHTRKRRVKKALKRLSGGRGKTRHAGQRR